MQCNKKNIVICKFSGYALIQRMFRFFSGHALKRSEWWAGIIKDERNLMLY